MDWETLGAGGGSGFVAAILTIIGFNRRLKTVEEEKVAVTVCDIKHDAVRSLAEKVDYLIERIDKLYDHQINGKK